MSNKTQPTKASVTKFLNNIEHDTRRADGKRLLELFKEITGEKPVMWGDSIVGFGQYHYKYASGREGDFLMTGFSPRKSNLSLYVMDGFKQRDQLLAKLGKHKTSVACLYINKLSDVDESVLKQLIQKSYEHMQKTYPRTDPQ
ncbi:MAG: DUF1801 domain-containing protein [Pseudomonadales bacterium]